jgi:hypothetical protein
MPFDPSTFEAELALHTYLTEELPTIAQDALEAGFDGPHTLRLAILDPKSSSEIHDELPKMLNELGLTKISLEQAAIQLATVRAKQLLESGEDPISSLPYFHRLLWTGDYPEDLYELAYLSDDWEVYEPSPEEQRRLAVEALENLVDPKLREHRRIARQAEWQRLREETQRDWPYVFNSATGRNLLKERFKEGLAEGRPLFVIEAAAWALLGWAFGSWKIPLIGFAITIPLLILLAYRAVYRKIKRERRDTLLRLRVPEDRI